MIGRLATPDDFDAIIAAHKRATIYCSPDNAILVPPDDVVRSNLDGHLFIAIDDDGAVAGTAILERNQEGFVWWLNPIDFDVAGVWAALGDAIIEATGHEPHGVVHNPDLRAALLAHERLSEDPDEPERLRWRKPE